MRVPVTFDSVHRLLLAGTIIEATGGNVAVFAVGSVFYQIVSISLDHYITVFTDKQGLHMRRASG